MKSFRQFGEDGVAEQLDEGSFVRAGAVAGWAAKAKKEGDAAARSFAAGKQALNRKTTNESIEARLARLDAVLAKTLEGMEHMRGQIGAGIAANVSAHLLNNGKKAGGRRKR